MIEQQLVVAVIGWPKTDYRLAYLFKTLDSIRQCVTFDQTLDQRIIVSCESAEVTKAFRRTTMIECHQRGVGVYWREEDFPGLGANSNNALRVAKVLGATHILLSQDDWMFQTPVPVTEDMRFLDERTDYALIRYATFYTKFAGMIDGTHGSRRLMDVLIPGPYAYGDQPHLRRATFDREFGWYYEHAPEAGEDYAKPEQKLADTLTEGKWKIAAYEPNVVEHCGTLSTSLERQGQAPSPSP